MSTTHPDGDGQESATSATDSAGRPSVRSLAADAIHAVDCGCDNPENHTPEVWHDYYSLADAVLAVVVEAIPVGFEEITEWFARHRLSVCCGHGYVLAAIRSDIKENR